MTKSAVPNPVRSRASRSARWLGAGLVATAGLVLPLATAHTALAAPPVFTDPPTRVYTAPGVDLPFTGPDAITGQSKNIVFTAEGNSSTCVVENPGDEGHSGNCIFAQIEILQAGRGTLTIDDSAIAYSTGNRSGDSSFNIGGKLADVQAAIASLVYVPPNSSFETTDAAPVTLRIDVQDAQSPSPDSTDIDIDIRVEGENAWPDLTAPQDDPYEVDVNQTFTILESQGTEVFTLTDEDAEQGDFLPPDYLLGVAWVDCGTMSFPVGNGYASYEGTPEDMLNLIGMDLTLIPGEVAGNLVLGTGWDNVTAVAWLAEIDINNDTFDDNFNQVMRWIEFHAPATAGVCTLTIVVTDLGNNGMPLSGEIPVPGVDFDSVQFNVTDPNAPDTTEGVEPTTTSSTTVPGEDTTTTTSTTTPDDDTTTTTSTTTPNDDTTTTSTTGPERTTTTTTIPSTGGTTTTTTTPSTGGTTTTTSTTVPGQGTTTTTSTTVPDDDTTTTTSTTVPDDQTTTTTSTTVPDDNTTTTSSTTVPDDQTTTTTSTTVPDDETTTTTSSTSTSTTLPGDDTNTTSSTTTTVAECPASTTTTSTTSSSSTSSTSSTTTTTIDLSTSTSLVTTTTIDPCLPPPTCSTTTTAATDPATTPPTAPPTAPPTEPTTPSTSSTTTTEATTTTTLPNPADTTTTSTPQVTTTTLRPRPTTTTIIIGIPTTSTTNPSTQGFRQVITGHSVAGTACVTASTVPPGGSLPPTGLSGPPGVLPVTGTDASTLVMLAALVALAGGAMVLAHRRPE